MKNLFYKIIQFISKETFITMIVIVGMIGSVISFIQHKDATSVYFLIFGIMYIGIKITASILHSKRMSNFIDSSLKINAIIKSFEWKYEHWTDVESSSMGTKDLYVTAEYKDDAGKTFSFESGKIISIEYDSRADVKEKHISEMIVGKEVAVYVSEDFTSYVMDTSNIKAEVEKRNTEVTKTLNEKIKALPIVLTFLIVVVTFIVALQFTGTIRTVLAFLAIIILVVAYHFTDANR